jgi:hypothetical protein
MFGGFSFFSPLPDQVYALKVAGQILRSKSLYSHQVTLVFVTVSAHSYFFFFFVVSLHDWMIGVIR